MGHGARLKKSFHHLGFIWMVGWECLLIIGSQLLAPFCAELLNEQIDELNTLHFITE